jgi:uncharacterized repeat protein (TIGR01451 family)
MWRSWTTGWLLLAAAIVCAGGMTGCNSFHSSGIDPTGEHFFVPPPPPGAVVAVPASPSYPPNERYFDDPMGSLSWDDVAVLIEPRELVAPVGSEVILIAGVLGPDGYLRTNRRLEWSITPGSVGQFVAVEPGGFTDLLLLDFTWPRIVNATTAIGDTSRSNVLLNRGTPTPDDDKYVRRGQGWISLTSPLEGTSYVNVVAPEVHNWDARRKTATVHWVDAVPQYPPPAINPAGTKHVFTTTVTRSSNQSPCENWIVRYQIVDGPPAGFLPSGAPTAEVRTNPAGQASVEIVEKQPASGVNKIAIQVIRPADAPGAGGQRLVVGNGCTTKTWSAPDLAVRVVGPSTAAIGGTLTYQIDVSNPGDLAAKDVTAVVGVPGGLTYLGGNPAAEAAGQQLRWPLGDLGARQRRSIQLSFRAEKQGSAVVCCDAAAAGGLKARDCATTTVALVATPPPTPSPTTPGTAATLSVSITPAQTTAGVGDKLTFEIAVTNRTQTTVTGGKIRVRFGQGLAYIGGASNVKDVVDGDVSVLAPNTRQRFNLKSQVVAAGRLGLNAEVTAPNFPPATAQAVVTAVGAAAPSTPGAAAVPLSLTIVGPTKPATVGDLVRFTVDVKNTGTLALQNVQLAFRCDQPLAPENATVGLKVVNGSRAWNIDSLLAGQIARYAIECRCQTPSAKASSHVTVTLPDGGQTGSEASVEILKPENPTPPPTPPPIPPTLPAKPTGEGLSLSAAGLTTPVHPNGQLTYEIRLTNKENVTYHQVVVTAKVADGMVPSPLGTVGATVDGQFIRFDPIAELPPGATKTYRAPVFAKQPGKYRLHVEMSTSDLPKPMAVDSDETEVTN